MSPQRVVFITGAASGIGAAVARICARRGDAPVLADIDHGGAQKLAAELGANALAAALDVRSEAQWRQALDAAWQRFGRVDVLLNNAGIVRTGYARDVSLEQHRMTLDVNLLGAMTGMLTALPRFKVQGHGHFVTVCSMSAFVPMTGIASYAASKHALRAFHHGLALEERDAPLHFTIVHPVATETPMLAQEERDDASALAFSEKTVSAEFVAATIVKAMDDKPAEIVMPPLFGRFLRMFGANPALVRALVPGSEAKGRKTLAARRARRE